MFILMSDPPLFSHFPLICIAGTVKFAPPPGIQNRRSRKVLAGILLFFGGGALSLRGVLKSPSLVP